MDFHLSEELKAIKRLVREFAEKEVIPRAEEWERKEIFPWDVAMKMGELGFFGAAFPKEYGGTEQGYLAHAIIAEEVTRAHAAFGTLFNMQGMTVPHTILKWGTKEQKEKFIPPMLRAEWLGCFALTEPNAASDTASMECKAVKEGDHYLLQGTKMWITHAPVFHAGVTFAKTDPREKHKGITAFIIERDMPGISFRKIEDKLGYRASPTGELIFDNCPVPVENLLGREGEGFTILTSALEYGRMCIAARSVGLAQACLDAGLKYAQEREQFGQKIGRFQMIKHLLADMITEVEAARLLTYRCAWMLDEGLKSTAEGEVAKYFSSEACLRAAEACARIHGAYTYSSEYPVARYYRDALLGVIGEGTSNIQRILIANRALGLTKER